MLQPDLANSIDGYYVRIATVNLLHGRSLTDGLVDTGRMSRAVHDLGASLVGLQEVDRNQHRSGNLDQTAAIASAMATVTGGASYRFVPAIVGEPGARWTAAGPTDPLSGHDLESADGFAPAYGIGMISLLPVDSWHVVRLTAAPVRSPILLPGTRRPMLLPDEPRVALVAVLPDGAAPFRTIATTHLSFVPGWNLRQLRRVLRALASLPGPRVLLGDLNLPHAVVSRGSRGWTSLAQTPTYPGPDPRIQFDHILTDTASLTAGSSSRAVAMAISDHRALVTDFR